MLITVDRDTCCGAGNCARVAPEVFDQDAEGLVVLLAPRPPGSLAEPVAQAADLCPSGAITVTGDRSATGG